MANIEFDVTDRSDDLKVITIGGRLDATTAAVVRPKMIELAQGAVKFVLDLSKLEWIDSSGVGALVTLYKRARTGGGDVKVAGLQRQPKEIFRLLRLEAALETFETVDDAAAKLAG